MSAFSAGGVIIVYLKVEYFVFIMRAARRLEKMKHFSRIIGPKCFWFFFEAFRFIFASRAIAEMKPKLVCFEQFFRNRFQKCDWLNMFTGSSSFWFSYCSSPYLLILFWKYKSLLIFAKCLQLRIKDLWYRTSLRNHKKERLTIFLGFHSKNGFENLFHFEAGRTRFLTSGCVTSHGPRTPKYEYT